MKKTKQDRRDFMRYVEIDLEDGSEALSLLALLSSVLIMPWNGRCMDGKSRATE